MLPLELLITRFVPPAPFTGSVCDEREGCREQLERGELQRDLDDDATPSRRAADGQPVPGSFDVPLRPYRGGPTDAR
ncbi:MAG TPA: hypothetical protein VE776_07740 [Actinomycetota bacterium]|jgi:hypothetical protein|nr:hypothetical protein [Actinomycetota bacterium]